MNDDLFIDYTDTFGNRGAHSHKKDELVLIRYGKMIVYTEKQYFVQEAPCCIFYKRKTMHSQLNMDVGKYERFCFQFDREYLMTLPIQDVFYLYPSDDAVCIPLSGEEIMYFWSAAKKLTQLKLSHEDTSVRTKLLFSWVLEELKSIYNTRQKLAAPSGVPEHYLLSVLRYIAGHLEEKLTIDSVADFFHVGRTKLTTDFRHYLAVSFNEYVTVQRLNAARILLLEGKDREDIAAQCGFTDSAYFSKVFKKHMGVTPSQYFRANSRLRMPDENDARNKDKEKDNESV